MRKAKSGASGAAEDTRVEDTARGSTLSYRVRRAKPVLVERCAEVDAQPQFVPNPGRHLEARILQKVEVYRRWLVENGFMPTTVTGAPATRPILAMIGHRDYKVTPEVHQAIASLADLYPADGSHFRHPRGNAIDLLIDDYEVEVRKRMYGLPVNVAKRDICWPSTAREIGCKATELDYVHRARLRAIDEGAEESGLLVGSRSRGTGDGNPAVLDLVRTAIERLPGLPADPLNPSALDYITIAEISGVSVHDILFSGLTSQVDALLVQARKSLPLIQHPLVRQRRFTYRQLIEKGRNWRRSEAGKNKNPGAAARKTVRALNEFLALPTVVGRADQEVPLDLPTRIRRAIASMPPSRDSGWAAQLNRWIGYYHAMRSEMPLPLEFGLAARLLAAEVGLSAFDLGKGKFGSVRAWLDGTAFPSHSSQAALDWLEDRLKVARGTLTKLLSAEFRYRSSGSNLAKLGYHGIARTLPLDFATRDEDAKTALLEKHWHEFSRQNVPYSQWLSHQLRDHYRLPFEEWPEVMRDAWVAQQPKVVEGRPERVMPRRPGERRIKMPRGARRDRRDKPRTWRPATEVMGKRLLSWFFGYLVRSRDPEAFAAARRVGKDGEVYDPQPGLGIPVELIHPAIFLVIDLFQGFTYWKAERSQGEFTVTPNLTMQFALDFLKPGTGLVWKDPGNIEYLRRFKAWWDANSCEIAGGTLVLDIDAFEEDWEAAVLDAYEEIRENAADLKPHSSERKRRRDPFLPIREYLDRPDPLAHYMKGVRCFLKSRPMTMRDRHIHTRDSVLTLILVQTALRANTLLLTVSGLNPTLRKEQGEDGEIVWRIVIPSERFKNYNSPFFQRGAAFDKILDNEDNLYSLLDNFMTKARPYLLAGRESDALFINTTGSDCHAQQLSNRYRQITARFILNTETAAGVIENGKTHGLHAVRHIVATTIVKKTGNLHAAAWAIQDTVQTVEQHYVEFLPSDRLKLVEETLRASRLAA